LATLSNSVFTTGKYIEHWVEAENIYAAKIAAIKLAKHSIHFETFFMTPGRRQSLPMLYAIAPLLELKC
jgi:cardiolipin synthase